MTKSNRSDIFSQERIKDIQPHFQFKLLWLNLSKFSKKTQVNIAQSCSKVLTSWNDFLEHYLKDKKWRRVLCVENRAQRLERLLSGCLKNINGPRLSNSLYSGKWNFHWYIYNRKKIQELSYLQMHFVSFISEVAFCWEIPIPQIPGDLRFFGILPSGFLGQKNSKIPEIWEVRSQKKSNSKATSVRNTLKTQYNCWQNIHFVDRFGPLKVQWIEGCRGMGRSEIPKVRILGFVAQNWKCKNPEFF